MTPDGREDISRLSFLSPLLAHKALHMSHPSFFWERKYLQQQEKKG
jgi:hypothetical protein